MSETHRGITIRRHDVTFTSYFWRDDETGLSGEAYDLNAARAGIDMGILVRGKHRDWTLTQVEGDMYRAQRPGHVMLDEFLTVLDRIDAAAPE